MPDWIERLRGEAMKLASVPVVLAFLVAVAVAVAAIWGAVQWSYGALLASKDARIAFLERRVNDYREHLSGATPDEAKQRIEALENEVKALRLRLQPRRLTTSQRQAIPDRSLFPAGAQPNAVTVLAEENCSDCTAFAADLAAALRESGSWIVTADVLKNPVERPRTGLAIRVPEPRRPPPEAVILQQAMRSAGLAYLMVPGGTGANAELLVTERVPQ